MSDITAEQALADSYSDETSVTRVVSAPVPLAFEKFREVCWLRTGDLGPASWTTIIIPGDENLTGETRMAAGIMKEKILRVTPNKEILYSVIGGPLPVNNHLGTVTFTEEGPDKTKIEWKVSFTPKMGMGLVVKGTVKSSFTLFLRSLENELVKANSSKQ